LKIPFASNEPDERIEATGIEANVIMDIARRQQHGIRKYGTTVDGNPLTRLQWLQHAYEEALDLAVYLKKCIKEESNAVRRS
jgi:hypothetical protein